ncbi:MAG: minor capsid protein [Campylobacterales bacterium]|nr:minor capsid protein [Campylobacterales bacterium]
MPPISFDFNLPPHEAIDYLEGKGLKLGFNYTQTMHEAHHSAFTVAKVTRLDLLSDIHDSIVKAQRDGIAFEQWKKDLTPTLKKYGWWGETTVIDPQTGEPKDIYVGSRRLRTIFDTNMRVSYSVGRHKQLMELSDSLYWRYSAVLDGRARSEHAAKNGIILHRDDPWWRTNYPPNAWNCRCKVRAYRKDEIDKKGWEVSEGLHVKNIASPDWAYDVGAGSRVGKLSKMDLDQSLSQLPKISDVKQQGRADLSEDELKKRFYDDLGIAPGAIYLDKVGDPMIVDDSLFTDKNTGLSKLTKEARHEMIDEFAKVLSNPDEIYIDIDKFGFKKNMFRYYEDNGEVYAVMAVFRYFKDKTQGATIFHVTRGLEERRKMKLVYQRSRD